MAATILVTGGTGRLGRQVVARLLAVDADVRVLARHEREPPARAAFFAADLRTGDGVERAVGGADVVVHCATSTRGDDEATANLVAAAARAGCRHLVHVSIVGIDHLASWGYPKRKLAAERAVESGDVPWTVLRVTQFYDYIATNVRRMVRLPVALVPAGFHVAPVDAGDVADRLVELALGPPAGRVAELAGPQATSWEELLRGYLRAAHRRRWVIPVRIPGTKAVRNGALLPAPGHAVAPRTWDDYLAATLRAR